VTEHVLEVTEQSARGDWACARGDWAKC